MFPFLKSHFDTEGPFGLPMKDAQAKALEARLRDLPKDDDAFTLRRCSFERGVSELQPGERADVSWITEESPDRLGDIVLASGMDDSQSADAAERGGRDGVEIGAGRMDRVARVTEGAKRGVHVVGCDGVDGAAHDGVGGFGHAAGVGVRTGLVQGARASLSLKRERSFTFAYASGSVVQPTSQHQRNRLIYKYTTDQGPTTAAKSPAPRSRRSRLLSAFT